MIPKELLVASGKRGLAGQTGEIYKGHGSIAIAKAAKIGVDLHLWAVLKLAVDALGLPISISSIDTGKHVAGSRHYDGRAVDISRVGLNGGKWRPATVQNAEAGKLVAWLLANGFRVGEGGPWAACLFGPPHSEHNSSSIDHSDHLHVSLPHGAA